jgi:serine/threonine-protein kinase
VDAEGLAGRAVGPYRVERLLGRGGMSAVFLATDTRDETEVALKILSPELADDEVLRQRFERESRLASALDHPNIVRVHEAGESNGLRYFAMDLVDGRDLSVILSAEGPFAPERAADILRQVAAALDVAHAAGIVHRDVKPGNILVARDGHAYLSDFGLVRRMVSTTVLTKTGEFMGTLDYVAPEQIQGRDVDARTDEYSLACVLYECLTGHAPYTRPEEMAVLYAHLLEAPPPVTRDAPILPKAADEVMSSGMAKSREDRYRSCGEFIEAFASVISPRGAGTVVGEVPKPPPRAPMPEATVVRARKPLVIGSLAAVVIMFVVLLSLRSSPPPPITLAGAVLHDTFAADDSGWTTGDIRGGKLVLSVSGANDNVVTLSNRVAALPTETIVTRASTTGPRANGFGIVCLASDDQSFYELVVSSSGTYAIDKARAGTFTRLTSGHANTGTAGVVLRADCTGSSTGTRLVLSVNGAQVASIVDTAEPYTEGRIGLTAITADAGGLRVSFDEIAVARAQG